MIIQSVEEATVFIGFARVDFYLDARKISLAES